MFKIASWNVNSLRVRLPHVLAWLEQYQPDVLAIQETKVEDSSFPLADIASAGYQACHSGQKTYNGVALLSRINAADVECFSPVPGDESRRIIVATYQQTRVINLYVPNGQAVDSEKYGYKLEWLAGVQKYIKGVLGQYERVVVLGDFNIAPEDRDVHDPVAWEGNVLCSPRERAALTALLELGLVDTFRLFDQDEAEFSWWDYRAAAFRRNMGLRIDLILASKELASVCEKAYIDKTPRKLERPSDHTPVVSEFAL